MAVLLVNGQYDYKERLWLEISLANIVKYISPGQSYKIFIWNNHHESQRVNDYLSTYNDIVEVLDETSFNLSLYDPELQFRLPPTQGGMLAGGFHPHSTPLQILYEYALSRYDIDIIFTFDNDSCPVRPFWDTSLVYALDNGKKITGIWRNELSRVIKPYIHPSCLGIKVETIRELNLRFNQLPVFGKIDTLAHFTYNIIDKYGNDSVYPLHRSNTLQYHPVFNGIYGGLMYHHHLGTRNRQGTSKFLKSYGWKERSETMIFNRVVMDGSTEMLFSNDQDFFHTLIYGTDYLNFRLYLNYLEANYSTFRAMKLFHHARMAYERDKRECFFILTLIMKELFRTKKFLDLYIKVCRDLGLAVEADAYQNLVNHHI